jgi:hypothetical protein
VSKDLALQNESQAVQMSQQEVMAYLGLNPRDPATVAHFAVCQRYDLDPLLKHVVIISGGGKASNLYVTRDGLLHVAHKSGRFDGLEVDVLEETQTHFVAAATVWRKDMNRPFRFQGRYPKGGMMAKHGPEMAEKVAVCRALRHAFDVALCSREETWEEEPEGLPEQNSPQRQSLPRPVSSVPPAPIQQAPRRMQPQPELTPEQQVVQARGDFARHAEHLGYDLRDSKGKWDGKAIADLFGKTLPEFQTEAELKAGAKDPASWVLAQNKLEPPHTAEQDNSEPTRADSDTVDAEFSEDEQDKMLAAADRLDS